MTGWWRRWRRRRTLARRSVPEPLWQGTLSRYAFLGARSTDDLAQLREMTTLFLAEKEFAGTRGLVVDDTMAVAIAAQACLPALKLGLDWYGGFVGIVVHEDAVVARREVAGDDGVVHAFDEELSGEAMHGGPVMLAWQDVEQAGASADQGYNVVVHEFAHVIDMHRDITAHPESADPQTVRGAWLRSLSREWKRFGGRVDRDDPTFLDPYGAKTLEEFFAVASEAFFVAPLELRAERPRTYELLAAFYRQDPAAWREPAGSTPATP
ncbi:MAG: M90 family metallopeptidase [Caldimonas sp.]